MNTKVFETICTLVYDEAGIRIREGKESMVASRLAKRIRALGLGDETEYLDYLERELRSEVVSLLDVISTNVTSFYREPEHFEELARLHEQALTSGRTRVRYWCAASSTGEEPYTIAITLREAERRCGTRVDTRLLATDISTAVLAEARAGLYTAERVRPVPKVLLDRYFTVDSSGAERCVRVRRDLSDLVLFKRLNLSQTPFPMSGPLDAIFCRNVMFYFDDPVRDALLDEFHRLLAPGGTLFVGKSESLSTRRTDFIRAGSSIYRRSN